jgi:hypothetical protein
VRQNLIVTGSRARGSEVSVHMHVERLLELPDCKVIHRTYRSMGTVLQRMECTVTFLDAVIKISRSKALTFKDGLFDV